MGGFQSKKTYEVEKTEKASGVESRKKGSVTKKDNRSTLQLKEEARKSIIDAQKPKENSGNDEAAAIKDSLVVNNASADLVQAEKPKAGGNCKDKILENAQKQAIGVSNINEKNNAEETKPKITENEPKQAEKPPEYQESVTQPKSEEIKVAEVPPNVNSRSVINEQQQQQIDKVQAEVQENKTEDSNKIIPENNQIDTEKPKLSNELKTEETKAGNLKPTENAEKSVDSESKEENKTLDKTVPEESSNQTSEVKSEEQQKIPDNTTEKNQAIKVDSFQAEKEPEKSNDVSVKSESKIDTNKAINHQDIEKSEVAEDVEINKKEIGDLQAYSLTESDKATVEEANTKEKTVMFELIKVKTTAKIEENTNETKIDTKDVKHEENKDNIEKEVSLENIKTDTKPETTPKEEIKTEEAKTTNKKPQNINLEEITVDPEDDDNKKHQTRIALVSEGDRELELKKLVTHEKVPEELPQNPPEIVEIKQPKIAEPDVLERTVIVHESSKEKSEETQKTTENAEVLKQQTNEKKEALSEMQVRKPELAETKAVDQSPQDLSIESSHPVLKEILEIELEVRDIREQIIHFTGTSKDKQYLTLNEMLIRNIIKLDDLSAEHDEEVRNERRRVIKFVQECLSTLERNAEKIKTDSNDSE